MFEKPCFLPMSNRRLLARRSEKPLLERERLLVRAAISCNLAIRFVGFRDERSWPTSTLVDHLVNLGHEADGFGKGDDDFVVVGDVVLREGAVFAIFEPFLADRVAADVEVPHWLAYTAEASALRLVYPHGVVRP